MRVLDVSEWTGPIDFAWWKKQRQEQGIGAAIIQCWGSGGVPGRRNEYLRQHTQGALEAGLKVATYCWPPSEWAEAIEWIGDLKHHYAFFALDVEANARVMEADVLGVRGAGLPPVIYASPSSWASIMGNARIFNNLPLWLARYPWTVPPESAYYRVRWDVRLGDAMGDFQIGGWEERDIIGWQFTGTVSLPPETADLNVFREDVFGKEDEMTPEEQARLKHVENMTKLQQAVLVIHRDRLAFNDELTRRLWVEVFGKEPDANPMGNLQQQLDMLDARLRAIGEAALG